MKTFGMEIGKDAFKNNFWYFRNALVRANDHDFRKGIHAATRYLEVFFSNWLSGTGYELKTAEMKSFILLKTAVKEVAYAFTEKNTSRLYF